MESLHDVKPDGAEAFFRSPPMHDLNVEDVVNHAEEMLYKVHPPRAGWYEALYAFLMAKATKSYEAEMAEYKLQLFSSLRGSAGNILEIGIGTGPNLKYYGSDSDACVFGIDPMGKMEKYALTAAKDAGIPSDNFVFKQAVAEALPVKDESIDVVIGTLVLCSVKDIDLVLQEIKRVLKPGGVYLFVEHVAAQDGTVLKFIQGLFNPLQRFVADGCHLTRRIGSSISNSGFSAVKVHQVHLSSALLMSPHVYGIATK